MYFCTQKLKRNKLITLKLKKMKNFKYQIGNKIEFSHNGVTLSGVITWAGYNVCTFEQVYNVDASDGKRWLGLRDKDITLIESGNHLNEEQKITFGMRRALERLGY